jgi:hypothetical protein
MKHVKKVFADKIKRGWSKIYIAIDLHDTIIEGKYNLNNDGANFFPNSIEVLRDLSNRSDICLILWTSSHIGPIRDILTIMEAQDVKFNYINENPECPNTELCDFNGKFYFNLVLDDKAGWDGSTDWFLFEETLREIGAW